MLYVVFTFGEMIIAIAEYFEGEINVSSLYFCTMAFLIVVGLFLSYGVFYDHILDREKQTSGVVYIIIHIFIIFALNNITVALEFMRNDEIALLPKMSMIIISFILFFNFMFMASAYAKQKAKPTVKNILVFSAICVAFAAAMLLLRANMYLNIALSVLFVFIMFLYIYRFKIKILKASK